MASVAFPLGRRIQKWRTKAGLSAAEVAKGAGLTASAYAEVEHGQQELSAYKFHRVALALGVDPGVLLEGGPGSDPLRSTARFRVQGDSADLAAEDLRLLALAAEVGRVGAALCDRLGDARASSLPRHDKPLGNVPWKQGYELGERARTSLFPDRQPLASVQAAFETLGVHVAFVALHTPHVEGVSLRELDALPVILLNTLSDRVLRVRSRRSILAHELCHLLHDGGDDHVVTVISRSTDFQVDIEQRANGFAPSFLAPPPWLDRGSEPEVLARTLVQDWSFSFEGAAWHTRNVLHLTESEARQLTLRLQDEGLVEGAISEAVVRAPGASPLVQGLVGDLAIAAAAADHISAARAREIAAIG